MKRTPIRRVSVKRAREMKEYARLRTGFMVERPVCEVWLSENGYTEITVGFYRKGSHTLAVIQLLSIGAPRSKECHHREGRGKNYLNVSTWLAVSSEAHHRIHSNPSWARANGFLA